jgi:PAS domain S-box-containing protein
MALPRLPLMPWGLPVLTGAYFLVGKLGLMLGFANSTAVWPPTGFALAATLLFGYRVWPALVVGSFLVNVTLEGSVWTALGIASGNTFGSLLGAFLVTRFANGRDAFRRARDIFAFAVLAGFLGTAVSATLGVTSLSLGGYASWERLGAMWLMRWLGHVAGALVVAPVLVLWVTDRTVRLTRARALELALLLGSVVLVGGAVFGGVGSAWARDYPVEFLCVPLLILAAFRFGPREAATCVVLLAVIATWGTSRGAGPFVWNTPNESLLLLQTFMGTMALLTLPLAAVVAERGHAEAALARVAAIVESSDDAIIGKTLDGMITTWNAAAERLYGYSAREAVGRPISIIIPSELRDELPRILTRIGRGAQVEPYDTVRMTKDGRRVDVSVTISPTRDADGRIVGASAIARDITRRKEAEAAVRERDTLRYVAGLAAAAAHEINNPLAAVMGHAQLLADEVDGKKAQRRIEEILEAIARIEEIVARMRRVTRIELTHEAPYLPEMLDFDKSTEPGPQASPGGRDARVPGFSAT